MLFDGSSLLPVLTQIERLVRTGTQGADCAVVRVASFVHLNLFLDSV